MADQYAQPFGKTLVAGDAWSWTIGLSNYSPALYTLKYFFRGPSKLDLTATLAADGVSFAVAAMPAQTEAMQAGAYGWQMCVFEIATGNRTELARGQVEVLADIASQDQGYESRSWVKISLDAVRAVLQNRAGRVEQEYTINGRQLRLMSPKDLLDLEGTFAARYRRELIQSGQLPASTNQVQGSFGDPTNPVLQRLWRNFPGNSQ